MTQPGKLAELSREDLETLITELVCKYNNQSFDQGLINAPIVNFRLESINAVSIVNDLEERLGVELFPTLFWEFDTIAEMADWIMEQKSNG